MGVLAVGQNITILLFFSSKKQFSVSTFDSKSHNVPALLSLYSADFFFFFFSAITFAWIELQRCFTSPWTAKT